MRISVAVFCIIPFAFLCSCGLKKAIDQVEDLFRDPSTRPVTETIKTILPVSYAVDEAMAAVSIAAHHGTVPSNVHLVGTVDSFPCAALMTIDYDNAYPLAKPAVQNAVIGVTGLWSDSNSAILTVLFLGGSVSNGYLAISNVSTIPVVRDSSGVTLVFAAEDINNPDNDTLVQLQLSEDSIAAQWTRFAQTPPLDSSIAVTQLAWVVTVENNHTPAIFADDVYQINGASQSVDIDPQTSALQIVQLVMFSVKMASTCRLNPAAGYAILKNTGLTSGSSIGVPDIGTTLFTFHPTCNGTMDVTLATGVYLGANGKSLAINLK
jgi:hypothetical protein